MRVMPLPSLADELDRVLIARDRADVFAQAEWVVEFQPDARRCACGAPKNAAKKHCWQCPLEKKPRP